MSTNAAKSHSVANKFFTKPPVSVNFRNISGIQSAASKRNNLGSVRTNNNPTVQNFNNNTAGCGYAKANNNFGYTRANDPAIQNFNNNATGLSISNDTSVTKKAKMDPTSPKSGFENCTFNNCVFNITSCGCDTKAIV